jgi:NitT/TauT family transport system permease protein
MKTTFWFWAQVGVFAIAWAESCLLPPKQNVKEFVYRAILALFIAAFLALRLAAARLPRLREKLYRKARFGFACGIALILWDILSVKTAVLPVPYFPSMADIVYKMFDDRALLAQSTLYSMRLFFAGLITGTALGLATGTLIGWFKSWDYWLSPIIRVSGIVPAVAWLPIALLLLPNAFTTGLFLIFMSSWFPVSSMMAR